MAATRRKPRGYKMPYEYYTANYRHANLFEKTPRAFRASNLERLPEECHIMFDSMGRIDWEKMKTPSKYFKKVPWYIIEANSQRWKDVCNAMARSLLWLGRVDWKVCASVYRPNTAKPMATLHKTAKHPFLAITVMQKLSDLLESGGLTPEAGAIAINEAIAIAREKQDARTLLAAGKEILSLHGAYQRATGSGRFQGHQDNALPSSANDDSIKRLAEAIESKAEVVQDEEDDQDEEDSL